MRRRKSRQEHLPQYDPSVWQFQLMPVSEMDIDERIAMDTYYANQVPPGGSLTQEPRDEDDEMVEEELPDWDSAHLPPTRRQIDEENELLLRRQRQFRLAAEYIARALAELPAVRKVALFGSVAAPLQKEVPRFRKYRRADVTLWHKCKDVDLAVWVDDLGGLKTLQQARANALSALLRERNVGVAHHQAELFIMEVGTGRYLGRLCCFGACPKDKRDCLVPGCGAHPFLKQHEGFTFHVNALAPEKSVVLFERLLP